MWGRVIVCPVPRMSVGNGAAEIRVSIARLHQQVKNRLQQMSRLWLQAGPRKGHLASLAALRPLLCPFLLLQSVVKLMRGLLQCMMRQVGLSKGSTAGRGCATPGPRAKVGP